jgi:L-ascorbate oxidase
MRHNGFIRIILLICFCGALSLPARAQSVELPLGMPAPASPVSTGGAPAAYRLDVRYADGTILNPVAGRREPVRLRSYVSETTDADIPFLAPLIEAAPGETVRLRVTNSLPAEDPSCHGDHANVNVPHCFNTTNIHAHGFWVSPSGNSDNVFVSIRPGQTFDYEYNIPEDHPSGTYFYHPHHHGSTALQVSSGLAGALIVRGGRVPRLTAEGRWVRGDLDTLLKTPGGDAYPERTIVFQQIPYACRNAEGSIRVRDDESWWCAESDTGTIENYDQFGQSTWDRSGRFNALNGHVMPTFTGAHAGRVERWRLIHAGVRDTVRVQLRKLRQGAAADLPDGQTPEDRQAFVDANCTGDLVPLFSVALDGHTRHRVAEKRDAFLQPGYREDLLVMFPEPGTYCVIDGEIPPEESISGRPQERALLGYVAVGGTAALDPAGVAGAIQAQLVASAVSEFDGAVQDAIVRDLTAGLALSAFVDHADIADSEITGKQTLGFRYHNVNLPPDPPRYQHEVGTLGLDIGGEMILTNSQPYDPDRIDRVLALGGADEWTLASFWGGHPFHIHINPFQIVSIVDRDGKDVSGPGTGQYAGLKGVWKDTLFIEEGYVFKVRSRYRRYVGDFVLHCHILDHEDKGMMQNVRIVLPD